MKFTAFRIEGEKYSIVVTDYDTIADFFERAPVGLTVKVTKIEVEFE